MRYVIGVDGGQTSTTAVLADESGRLLGVGHGGPANHIHEPGGLERIQKSLGDAIAGARSSANRPNASPAAAYLGMTGGSPQMEEICRPVVPADIMTLGHDSLIALYSVTLGKPGVAVIGGTGSVGFGRDSAGRTALSGGWGYVMGDEGSAYWIAVQALNACTRASDRRGPRTTLLPYLLRRIEATNLKDIYRLVYSGALSRPDLAALSAAVAEAAQEGDRIAQRILRSAGKELGLLATVVIRKLKMSDIDVEVGTVGGVFRAGDLIREPFTQTVRRAAPHAKIISPRIPAAVAAVLLALEGLGIAIDDHILANVRATLPRLGILKE